MTEPPNRRSIELLDRSAFFDAMNDAMVIDPAHTAVLTIDMHRGHLDPEIATMPVVAEVAGRLVETTAAFLAAARAAGLTIIHSVTVKRDVEAAFGNPFGRVLGQTGQSVAPAVVMRPRQHNLEGSPHTELMSLLGPAPDDLVLMNKKQLSAFYATDLDQLLRVTGIDTLVMLGVGTNTCILSTALDASNRGLKVIVVGDCTVSLNGDDLHEFGLENIRRTIGWVRSSDELAAHLAASAGVGE
jgi:nicotinamidase-related amidase